MQPAERGMLQASYLQYTEGTRKNLSLQTLDRVRFTTHC